eukprot:evm.model.scf_1298.1 EVM.evm.TU.scf_1298.1   scf_1298:76-1590(-)
MDRLTIGSFDDLEEGIIKRIFEFVVGLVPVCHAWDSVFGRRFEDNKLMTPSCVEGFAYTLVLPQVCKRWELILRTSPCLRKRAYVDTITDREYGYDEICPMPSSVPLTWWMKHSKTLESVHIRGNIAGNNAGGLGMYHMGLVSLLDSKLRVLHLDDCFENGAPGGLMSALVNFAALEQLRLMRVQQGFLRRLPDLCRLGRLRRLELQGVERGTVELNCSGLPRHLEVLSLALVEVCGHLGPGKEPLSSLRVLKLVHIEWCGPFCSHMQTLSNMESLVINNVFIDSMADELREWPRVQSLKKLSHLEVGGELEPGFSQRVGERLIECLPFPRLSKLCLKFQSRSSGMLNNQNAQFGHLTHLYLECFEFEDLPNSLQELTGLKQLGLVDCQLASFQGLPKAWVEGLTLLDISKNPFQTFPSSVLTLRSLTDLNVSHSPAILCECLNALAALPDLLTLRLLGGECLVLDFDGGDAIESLFSSRTAAFRMGSLFTALQVNNPKCHLYL